MLRCDCGDSIIEESAITYWQALATAVTARSRLPLYVFWETFGPSSDALRFSTELQSKIACEAFPRAHCIPYGPTITGIPDTLLRFVGLEMPWSISPDQFPFRLQPIFEVIAEQSAVGAVDLVRAIQNLFDLQRFADCASAKHHVLQFNLFCNFVM